ncbi:MAG: bifunctional DNA-formamidopyrimidine glycosylase/DNA-(apurinic or apyrimidinic site) lyase [Acidobacteria bacterium]|nr:MAG: bifunctional DNA-formamidopyrimidine glycosylase/DNA-(apurinic or apyrimidinic site) lyase [Acidobacteriota bacterium]
MPELPEVEVLRRSLEPLIIGDTIARVEVWNASLREPVDRRKLERLTSGRTIRSVRRRAKYLLADLDGGTTLVTHLGMSGRMTLVADGVPRELHEHVAFFLDSGRRLRLRDPRRFGLVLVMGTDELDEDRHFRHLGIEPLGNGFGGRELESLARRRRAPVKSFLMDARVLVGVGNIYASEALYRAGIHPTRSVSRISSVRWQRLADSIRQTLSQAVQEGGTTLNDFADGRGREGMFQVSLATYDREGETCGRCGGTIRRIVQSGRSTYYCPGCQR